VTTPTPRELACAWWDAIDRIDFDAAAALLAPDTVVDWPLSNERMSSPSAWKSVNEHYPGRWHASIRSLVAEGETVVTNTEITDGSIVVTAISWFTIRDGRIVGLVEYWPEAYAAPGWRAAWVEPISA
jgi:ketosteroid isomerase-like protein